MNTEYTIRAGDTLHRIARQYNTTVASLAASNSIQNPNRIRAGATIQVPGQPAAGSHPTKVAAATTTYGTQYVSSTPTTSSTSTSFSDTLAAATSTYGAAAATGTYGAAATAGSATTVANVLYRDMTGHPSGYKGLGYYDEYGRAFTNYGAYLREDGFFYPEGATISKNGMYFDDGSGWKFAKHKLGRREDGSYGYMPSEVYGLAPNTRLDIHPDWQFR